MGTGPSLGEPHHKQLNMLNTTLINSINIQSLGTPWVLPPSYKLLCLKLKKISENKFLLLLMNTLSFITHSKQNWSKLLNVSCQGRSAANCYTYWFLGKGRHFLTPSRNLSQAKRFGKLQSAFEDTKRTLVINVSGRFRVFWPYFSIWTVLSIMVVY